MARQLRATMTRRKTTPKRSQLGSIRQLPSGRWQARYKVEAQTFKAPMTFETRQEANNWLAGEFADRARGIWVNPLGNPLGQYATNWLESRVDLARNSRERYKCMINRYILADYDGFSLAPIPLGQISPQHIRKWLTLVAAKAEQSSLAREAPKPVVCDEPTTHPARAWGLANGWKVKPSGKLPKELKQAWAKACPKQAKAYKRPRSKGEDKTGYAKQIRAWGMENGWQLSASGRLPVDLTKAWLAHHSYQQAQDNQEDGQDQNHVKPGAPTTAKAYATLRTIFNAAITDGLLHFNPCRIRGAGQCKAMERTPATVEQVQAIADLMPKQLASAVIVAAWSGLRRGELFALARKHVDLETGAIRVERTLTRQRTFSTPKTASSVRTVYLPSFVLDVLAKHMDTYTRHHPDALIWAGETGEPIRQATVSTYYRKAREQVGRPDLRWHDLRHTGATLAYQAGGNVRDVQRRLGHSTVRAAMIYAHAADKGDQVLAERLDEAFNPNRPPEPTQPQPPTTTPTQQPDHEDTQTPTVQRPALRLIQGGKAIA